MESCTNCDTEMTAEHVCLNCGLASDEREFVLEPPRSHELDEPNRETSKVRADRSAPSNLALHDFGLGSRFNGSQIEGDMERCELFARMETLNEDEPSEADRSLRAAMCSIDALGELLNLPKSVERRVAYLYRKARGEGLTQRRDLRAVLGALIAVATRENGTPRARAEILNEANKLSSMHPQLGRHHNREGRNVAKSELVNVERKMRKSFDLDVPTPEPKQYVPQFAAELGLKREDMILAMRICRFVDTSKLSRDPKLAAAAVLYAVGKKQTTIPKISEKLPVGHTARLSTMADKIVDLICDQVYNPSAEVESSASPGTFEYRFDRMMTKFDDEKIGEAKEFLWELLKKQGKLPAKNPAVSGLGEFATTDILLGQDREEPDDNFFSEKDRKKSRNKMNR